MLTGPNTNEGTQCLAYVFSDSAQWRKYTPDKYTMDLATGAIVAKSQVRHERPAQYDRERDRSPQSRLAEQTEDDILGE
jgi:hypothetical protein